MKIAILSVGVQFTSNRLMEKKDEVRLPLKKQRKSAYKCRIEQIHVTKSSKYSVRDLDLQVQYSHFTDEETDQVM